MSCKVLQERDSFEAASLRKIRVLAWDSIVVFRCKNSAALLAGV